MDGWLIYAGLIIVTAALLALGRGWWFGLPASVVASGVLLIFGNDYLALVGIPIAAVSGAMLPSRDRLLAIPIGLVLAPVSLFIAAAPDSPATFIMAACAGMFALGALTGSAIAAMRRNRDGPAPDVLS